MQYVVENAKRVKFCLRLLFANGIGPSEQCSLSTLGLHTNLPTLRALPFPLLMVNMALELLHFDFAVLASHLEIIGARGVSGL